MRLNREIGDRIEDPTSKRRYVRWLFGSIATRYDLTNDVMSVGLHRRWKRRVLELARIAPGQRILDLAAGTGDLALGAGAARGVEVVAADLTPAMMEIGRARDTRDRVAAWIAADATHLPFPQGSFDRVVIGYGLRNFPDLGVCLDEILRVLRPGGRMVALDFGHPRSGLFGRLYRGYLNVSTRAVGWVMHRNAEAYVYIPESLRRFPGQRGVERLMIERGYVECGVVDLLFGAMAINYGEKPV